MAPANRTAIRSSVRVAAAVLAVWPLLGGVGCKGDGKGGDRGVGAASSAPSSGSSMPAASMQPSASAGATVMASSALPSGSASSTPPGSAPSGAAGSSPPASSPEGSGVTDLSPLGAKADCQAQTSELATYLQRGAIAMAARDSGVAASWMIQAPGKADAQIAFGGYDGQAKPAARVRGIGAAREFVPRVFSTGSQWTVTWFDADGLAFTRPAWDKITPPKLEHLGAVGRDVAEDIAVASTPAGSLVAVAPFGADRTQLGLFLFAPTDPEAPALQALGVSRYTVKPHRPAVAADDSGYYVGWLGAEDAVRASHFDIKGKEGDVAEIALGGAKRQDLTLVALPSGALALWIEGDMVVSRPLGKMASPSGPAKVVAKGARFFAVTALGAGALVVWVGKEGKADGQLSAAKVGADGAPSAAGLIVSDEGHLVKDPPSVAVTGGRVAFGWTEVMSATVSTKRALLRTVEAACVP